VLNSREIALYKSNWRFPKIWFELKKTK
jgi:hypothetical protein